MRSTYRSTFALVLALLALPACGGSPVAPPPASGAARFGAIAGNHQTVHADVFAKLPQNVTVQIVATPLGVSVRQLSPLEVFAVRTEAALAATFLPPMAFAQTGVHGVPNQVVCFGSTDPRHALHAEVPCASSDSLGLAYFVPHADTIAGISRADVSAALPTGTKITDSVTATVLPSVPAELSFYIGVGTSTLAVASGVAIDLHRNILYVRDRYQNFIAPDSASHISQNGLADTTTTFTPGWAMRDGTEGAAPTSPDSIGWTLTPRLNPTGRSVKDINGHYAPVNLYIFGGGRILTIVPLGIR